MKVSVPDVLEPGAYEMRVLQVEVREFDNTKFGAGTREVAVVTFGLVTGGPSPFTLKYYPTLKWTPKSKWQRLLRTLGATPVPGTDFELNDLIGLRAVVVVGQESDDGDTVMKIVDVQSIDEYEDSGDEEED